MTYFINTDNIILAYFTKLVEFLYFLLFLWCFMEQSFGNFIKIKRKERMMKLNTFARKVGISTVYASYIENGKRPAPSKKVLDSIICVLQLSKEETEALSLLAARTHHRPAIPEDLIEYINSNESVILALRTAKNYHTTEKEWFVFINQIISKHSHE